MKSQKNEYGEVTTEVFGTQYTYIPLEEVNGNPKLNKWYRISAEGAMGGYNPVEVYGAAKRGCINKLAVIFDGGGVAWDEYMSARPMAELARTNGDVYYFDNCGCLTDILTEVGIEKICDDNPLRDWCMINLPYNTGDFHIGTGDYEITDLDGKKRTIHFHGYTNYRMIVEKAKAYFGFEPEELLVCGCSAGAFGTALLTDDVMDIFPSVKKCWCVPDSALMRHQGFHFFSEKVWKAPAAISDRLISDDIVLDSLIALKKKRRDSVQIMYISSFRDAALSEYVGYLEGRRPTPATKELCDGFESMLKDFITRLRSADPSALFYIFDTPIKLHGHGSKNSAGATQHGILMDPGYYTIKMDEVSVRDWIGDALTGNTYNVGLKA